VSFSGVFPTSLIVLGHIYFTTIFRMMWVFYLNVTSYSDWGVADAHHLDRKR
jgi:hypothetical protein